MQVSADSRSRIEFADPRNSALSAVAVGGELIVDNLVVAYQKGIFPFMMGDPPTLVWLCPKDRAVLEFDRLHLPRSLRTLASRRPYALTMDRDFAGVVDGCARASRPGGRPTWITDDLAEGYRRLHAAGRAHSVEAWDGGELVGGVLGVDCGGVFAAESMFYRRPDASKLAFLHLVDHLAAGGARWVDLQQTSPLFDRLGARVMARERYLDLLEQEQARRLVLFDRPEGSSPLSAQAMKGV
ncbi:leucyl/phenylalanyl-tRNA--protein transferase [Nonomuraea sp. KM90]|uniref:leucyl/phenylalanyl-tRNA--protein transferase n=1 Tax=Nonomuraea sp. KM90 TaxID=3457428 RepID=UPI003FCE012D